MAIAVGSTVKTIANNVAVRNTPDGSAPVAYVAINTQGTVTKPFAVYGTGGYWYVAFTTGVSGWVWMANIAEVPAAANPTITNFTATPSTIDQGQSSTLNATVTNETALELNGTPIPGLPLDVTPAASTAYVLTAIGAAGTTPATAQVSVMVNAVVPPNVPNVVVVPINMAAVMMLDDHWPGGDRYDRHGNHVVKTASTFTLKFGVKNQDPGGGGRINCLHPRYSVRFDGVERGACVVGTDRKNLSCTITLGAEPDGPVLVEIIGTDLAGNVITGSTETTAPFYIFLDRNGQARNCADVIVQNTTHALMRESWSKQSRIRVPKTMLKPREFPIAPIVGVPFFTAIAKEQITREMLMPSNEANALNTYKPCITKRGIVITENIQGYPAQDMNRDWPRHPELDGKRGTSASYYVFDILPGREGKRVYFTGPYGVAVVSNDGTSTGAKHTQFGLVHEGTPPWFKDATQADCKLRGDWSNIPATRHGLRRSWGIRWDPRTTPATGPIVNGEPSHLGILPNYPNKVIGYAADDFGRLLIAIYNGIDPNRSPDPTKADPPILKEVIPPGTLNRPWGIAIDPTHGEILIAEEGGNCISRWGWDTFEPRGYIARGGPDAMAGKYGYRPKNPHGTAERWNWGVGSSQIPTVMSASRVEPVVGPQRLVVADGMCYFSSLAQGEIRRAPLGRESTRAEIEVCCRPHCDFGGVGSYFIDFCVNDNTPDADGRYPRGGFGPHGTIFEATFFTDNMARPVAHLPYVSGGLTHNKIWYWTGGSYDGPNPVGVIRGPGGLWPSDTYPITQNIGFGVLWCSSSMDGVFGYRQRTAADLSIDIPRMRRGESYWKDRGYHLKYGQFGYGYFNFPLPWGENTDLDYTMQRWGHTP